MYIYNIKTTLLVSYKLYKILVLKYFQNYFYEYFQYSSTIWNEVLVTHTCTYYTTRTNYSSILVGYPPQVDRNPDLLH